jgi:hypothetical protein
MPATQASIIVEATGEKRSLASYIENAETRRPALYLCTEIPHGAFQRVLAFRLFALFFDTIQNPRQEGMIVSIETWIALTVMAGIIAIGAMGALLLQQRRRRGKAGA